MRLRVVRAGDGSSHGGARTRHGEPQRRKPWGARTRHGGPQRRKPWEARTSTGDPREGRQECRDSPMKRTRGGGAGQSVSDQLRLVRKWNENFWYQKKFFLNPHVAFSSCVLRRNIWMKLSLGFVMGASHEMGRLPSCHLKLTFGNLGGIRKELYSGVGDVAKDLNELHVGGKKTGP